MSNDGVVDSILEHYGGKDTSWSAQIDASRKSSITYEDIGEDFLIHYGKKGMRWGVRRKQKVTKYVKPATHLSDQELAKRIKRLEQEKKYNKLNKKEQSKGKKAAEEVLTNSGKAALAIAITGAGAAAWKLGKEAVQAYFAFSKIHI